MLALADNMACIQLTISHSLIMSSNLSLESFVLHKAGPRLTHCLPLQMEACLVAISSSETLVDFAFYKPGQIALLLKDKSRVSHGGSTSCRLVIFALQDLPFMLLDRYSNGTNQLSQHVFEVRSHHMLLATRAGIACFGNPCI